MHVYLSPCPFPTVIFLSTFSPRPINSGGKRGNLGDCTGLSTPPQHNVGNLVKISPFSPQQYKVLTSNKDFLTLTTIHFSREEVLLSKGKPTEVRNWKKLCKKSRKLWLLEIMHHKWLPNIRAKSKNKQKWQLTNASILQTKCAEHHICQVMLKTQSWTS